MYYVYVIRSDFDRSLYYGFTHDINKRLDEHKRIYIPQFFVPGQQMTKSYYQRMRFFTANPFWKMYLSWAYQQCTDDLQRISYRPNFLSDNFTALLCGTSGEITSLQFARFVFEKNPKARIIVLDFAQEQLKKSEDILSMKYPDKNINYVLSDAKRTPFEDKSIDYIETDGFLEYFYANDLCALLQEWNRILRPSGFITTREFASNSWIGRFIDKLRLFAAKYYLGVTVYAHKENELTRNIQNAGFRFVKGGNTFIPTLKRFSMIKIAPE